MDSIKHQTFLLACLKNWAKLGFNPYADNLIIPYADNCQKIDI